MEYTFRILRYDSQKDEQPYFQDYLYEPSEEKSILEALMDIRNEQDCDLSFRYSCREAICGSCGLVINGKFDLACRTGLGSLVRDTPEKTVPTSTFQSSIWSIHSAGILKVWSMC